MGIVAGSCRGREESDQNDGVGGTHAHHLSAIFRRRPTTVAMRTRPGIRDPATQNAGSMARRWGRSLRRRSTALERAVGDPLVVLDHVELDEPPDGCEVVERVQEQPAMLERAPPGLDE